MLSAFFTIFTGGSGVTILALGGLLLPALIKDGYREKFSVGLLTASGSLGLLLPPSLPLILYAIVAQIPVEDLFIGGICPVCCCRAAGAG
jgi:TRAP-type C4-dicarboxylate transport system permease large subunit